MAQSLHERFPGRWTLHTFPGSIQDGQVKNAACYIEEDPRPGQRMPWLVDATVGLDDGQEMVDEHNELISSGDN